jgi:hypothetical protein
MFKDFNANKTCDYIALTGVSILTTDVEGLASSSHHIFQNMCRKYTFYSRFIALDLFLPARKLKIINIYCHQKKDYNTKGKPLIKLIIEHIKQAHKDGFKIIILGDDLDTYLNVLV